MLYQKEKFPKMLEEDSLMLEEEKRKIRELLKKPWNPYIRRHTAATEISKAVQDPVKIDKYFGWRHSGNTRQKYQHYYSDDGIDGVLEKMDGLAISNSTKNKKSLLKPKQCPNCDEPNKPESKFCNKCKFVLSYDAFNEIEEERVVAAKEAENTKKELEKIKTTTAALGKNFIILMSYLQRNLPIGKDIRLARPDGIDKGSLILKRTPSEFIAEVKDKDEEDNEKV